MPHVSGDDAMLLIDRPRVKVRFYFERRDLWVGLFWYYSFGVRHFYVCVLPCLPLHITIWTSPKP